MGTLVGEDKKLKAERIEHILNKNLLSGASKSYIQSSKGWMQPDLGE